MEPFTLTAGFCAPLFWAAPCARGIPEVIGRFRRPAGEGEETGRDRPLRLPLAGSVWSGVFLAFVKLPAGDPGGGRTGLD